MRTLGINAAYHDPAACLVEDGRVLAAAEEERFTHVKHGKRPIPFSTHELPFHAIDYCLREAGIQLVDVDHVAYSFNPWLLVENARRDGPISLLGEAGADPKAVEWESAWAPLFAASIMNAPHHLAAEVPHHLLLRLRGARSDGPFRWHFVDHRDVVMPLLQWPAATQAEIDRVRAQQHYLEEQLRLLSVTSPISGVVITPKLKDKLGQDLKKGDLVAVVHELKTVTAEITIPENEIADVHLGQKVVLKARAYPQRSFFGTVTAVAPVVSKQDETHVERTIRVNTQLANTDLLLKSEMSGNAKIYCGKQRIISLVTRRLVRYARVEFWSLW